MSAVLDANVLVKLVIEEPHSKDVRKIVKELSMKAPPYTVDIALSEALNAIWKHVTVHKDLSYNEAVKSGKDLKKIYEHLTHVPAEETGMEALRYALDKNITVYGSLYVALARSRGVPLVTCDSQLKEKVEGDVWIIFIG